MAGGSQGGGIALAVAGLVRTWPGVLADVPFLQHIRRATEITDAYPYKEVANFCQTHRDKIETVFRTLSYFDGLNFAARATAPALYSVALMDDICPPDTVFASYNHYLGPEGDQRLPLQRARGRRRAPCAGDARLRGGGARRPVVRTAPTRPD